MKKKLLFLSIYLIACPWLAFSQAGEWTWISGVNYTGFGGAFGTKGVPNVNNSPPGLYEACEWKDHQGNFWLFGGKNYPASQYWGDLWRYNPVTNEWTWMTGTATSYSPSSYGTQGVASPANAPGERGYGAMTWTDTIGNLWMFGGYSNATGYKNDIWKYDISSNLWTWMNGDSAASTASFGTQGVPSPTNKPPGLCENACTWLDKSNNLWLFGGSSYSDVWKYDISINEWTWIKGTSFSGTLPTYGTLGVPDPNNTPGGRQAYAHWTNDSIHFWTFAGSGNGGIRNDTWMFNSITSNWTWMSGPNTAGDTGSFGTQCSPLASNVPQSRYENRSSVTDNCGKFWIFGGVSYNSSGMNSDLWKYDPVINEWTFISPSNLSSTPVYGTKGIPNAANIPGGRMGAIAWMDAQNNYWLYGGFGDAYVTYGDLWRFVPDTTCGGGVCSQSGPPVALFQSSDTTFCTEVGECINFYDLSSGNPTSWRWIFTGAIPDSSNQQNPTNICYYNPGTYPVTLIVSNANGTDTLAVNPLIIFGTAPSPPTVIVSGDTVFCSHASSYQWYYNGAPISGAIDSFYIATQSGIYSAQITENGCAVLSNGVTVTITSVAEHMNSEIKIYPNPAHDMIMVYGLRVKTSIEIYNVLGEKVYGSEPRLVNSKPETIIDISSFSKGVYFISVIEGDKINRAKIVKE